MDVVELYSNESFNSLLEMIASKNHIRDFDDYRQDVFLDIVESGVCTNKDALKSARKIGMRYYREQLDEDAISYAYMDDSGMAETEDEVMSRLVYEGKSNKL